MITFVEFHEPSQKRRPFHPTLLDAGAECFVKVVGVVFFVAFSILAAARTTLHAAFEEDGVFDAMKRKTCESVEDAGGYGRIVGVHREFIAVRNVRILSDVEIFPCGIAA